MIDINGDKLKIEEKFTGVRFIIIDEYSMVSQIMLAMIDKETLFF